MLHVGVHVLPLATTPPLLHAVAYVIPVGSEHWYPTHVHVVGESAPKLQLTVPPMDGW